MSEFTSNNNKSILWDILVEQNLFEGIDMKFRNEIKDAFEQNILQTEKQGRGLSLIEKNKDVIKNMVIVLDTFKRQAQTTIPRQYTNEELHNERQKAFERELKRKQTEFDGLARTMPEKIDFSDKSDDKIGDRMDMLLSEAIASREKQLNQLLQVQNPELATKWIENGGNGINSNDLDNFGQINPHQNINLKIGGDAHIQDHQIVNLDKNLLIKQNAHRTKVSFNDDNNKTLNFSTESAPNTIIRERENHQNNQPIYNVDIKKDDDITFNFFKMLKKEEPESSNETTLSLNTLDASNTSNASTTLNKDEIEIINRKVLENNIRLDIDSLKNELCETNKSVDDIKKSIDSLNSKQEEILFILKLMMRNNNQTTPE